MIKFNSKLGASELSIFTKMSAMATKYDAINLGQGFPNFDCDPHLKSLISKYLDLGKSQYALMSGVSELRYSIAAKCNQLYHRDLNPDSEITVTAGATQAIFTVLTAFVKAGDEVIVFDPAYDSYKPCIALHGAKTVVYELQAPDFKIDWQRFKSLTNNKTKMVIINNPHNPLGTTYSENDLLQLQEILSGTDIIVLSDEVYEHLVFDNCLHHSVLSYNDLFNRTLSVYSFGKTFHITGWKLGYCVGPEYLMSEFRKVHQWNVFSVNSFVQYAIAEYLGDESNYLTLSSFYEKKRNLFNNALKGSRWKALACKGTYFQLYDYSEISNLGDTEFAEWLVNKHGIASIPISVFFESKRQDNLIRFCFAKTDEVLVEAAEVLSNI